MNKVLTRLDIGILYIDDIFRSKEFYKVDEYRSTKYFFPIAEVLEKYSDSPNLRIVHINRDIDNDTTNDHEGRFKAIRELIASFDDEATLIIARDYSLDEDKYAEMKMYPISSDNAHIEITYVYENGPGVFLLDNMAQKEN